MRALAALPGALGMRQLEPSGRVTKTAAIASMGSRMAMFSWGGRRVRGVREGAGVGGVRGVAWW